MASKNRSKTNNEALTINEKFVIYLNDALAIENAAIKRLQQRTKQASLSEAKDQLRHHLEETMEQQKRLKDLVSTLGGKATQDSAKLPLPAPPVRLTNIVKQSFTDAERELIAAKEDAIIENAEIVMYDTLTQLAQIMGVGDAVPVLAQNLQEEREMADWLRANTPVMIAKLYPEIQASVASEPSRENKANVSAEA